MTAAVSAFLNGWLLMGSLIFAVGPQNAMLIRHGLRRDRPLRLAAVFTLCDLVLVGLGVAGVGRLVAASAPLRRLAAYGGGVFLLWFSTRAFRDAWRGGHSLAGAQAPEGGGRLLATALAVSLLNPGALIDTLVIVGSVSSRYHGGLALLFGLGAQVFSAGFFFGLALFTAALAPALNRPAVWRGVDAMVGLITAAIAIALLRGA